ncbi:DUF7282 domain-containing protein [Hyphomicrobium sp.]|uniref:DUF7282 domain-containing protein n=1 Tax=Hyphomicrobium sp. TaxID=82 RepID=UPI003F72CD61
MYRSGLGAAALLCAPLFVMNAFAAPQAPKAQAAGEALTDPSVIVFDQRSGSKAVSFSYVYLPTDGYVAVYGSDAEGKAKGDVLGYAPLPAGDHRNVSVDLGKELTSGMILWGSLYQDVDGDKKLDKGKDTAFWPDGKPLENRFSVL